MRQKYQLKHKFFSHSRHDNEMFSHYHEIKKMVPKYNQIFFNNKDLEVLIIYISIFSNVGQILEITWNFKLSLGYKKLEFLIFQQYSKHLIRIKASHTVYFPN